MKMTNDVREYLEECLKEYNSHLKQLTKQFTDIMVGIQSVIDDVENDGYVYQDWRITPYITTAYKAIGLYYKVVGEIREMLFIVDVPDWVIAKYCEKRMKSCTKFQRDLIRIRHKATKVVGEAKIDYFLKTKDFETLKKIDKAGLYTDF